MITTGIGRENIPALYQPLLVFLRHYCVLLSPAGVVEVTTDFPADRRAARGFNGDLADHLERWRAEHTANREPAALGRRIARKILLAVAGLVSVHDLTWTTDRHTAATRWAQVRPGLANDLELLSAWSDGDQAATAAQIDIVLDRAIVPIVESFALRIGLWQ